MSELKKAMGKFALEVHVPTVLVETLCMIGAVVTAFAVICTLDRLMHDRCMECRRCYMTRRMWRRRIDHSKSR